MTHVRTKTSSEARVALTKWIVPLWVERTVVLLGFVLTLAVSALAARGIALLLGAQ